MKPNMLEVLLYIFNNYLTESKLVTDATALSMELEAAGFEPEQIQNAFDWLQALNYNKPEEYEPLTEETGIRVFDPYEAEKLSAECKSILMFLEQAEIIEPAIREQIIDQAMNLDLDEVEIKDIRSIILMNILKQPNLEKNWVLVERLFAEGNRQYH